jgi:hypothetical protein
MFRDSPLADAGIYQMDKQRLPIPGNGVVDAGHSATPRLKSSHPLT